MRENGEGDHTSGVRSGELLNSCPSFQIRGAWVFHDSVIRTGKMGGAQRYEEECNIWDASSFLLKYALQVSRGSYCRFSKCSTASLFLPTHQGFNSKAAEVISIPFDSYIFTTLPSLLHDWTGITMSVHEDFSLVLYFSLHLTCVCKKANQ